MKAGRVPPGHGATWCHSAAIGVSLANELADSELTATSRVMNSKRTGSRRGGGRGGEVPYQSQKTNHIIQRKIADGKADGKTLEVVGDELNEFGWTRH